MTRPTDAEIAALLRELANSATGLAYESTNAEATRQMNLVTKAHSMAAQLEQP